MPFLGIARSQSQFPHHTHVSVSNLYIPKIGPHISLQLNRQINPRNIEISHRYMSVQGTGRQNIIILFWITFSFLGIHKWEPDICIGFSPVLHMQCGYVTVGVRRILVPIKSSLPYHQLPNQILVVAWISWRPSFSTLILPWRLSKITI
jgi:hypothetical protein